MATLKLFIALSFMELVFRYHQVSQDTWFISYTLLFGMWIVGGEIGRIGDAHWKIEQHAKNFFDTLIELFKDDVEEEEENNG